MSALFMAAAANHVDVMKALVAAGADPKLRPQDESTLLMAAASSGHLDPVKYAFQLDPDIKAVTKRKSTVMHAALQNTLPKSTQDEICRVIQFLADNGAELDAFDGRGQTPISIGNVIPVDKATFLIGALIEKAGGTPKIAPKK
jgi:ankyrin repeat protein